MTHEAYNPPQPKHHQFPDVCVEKSSPQSAKTAVLLPNVALAGKIFHINQSEYLNSSQTRLLQNICK